MLLVSWDLIGLYGFVTISRIRISIIICFTIDICISTCISVRVSIVGIASMVIGATWTIFTVIPTPNLITIITIDICIIAILLSVWATCVYIRINSCTWISTCIGVLSRVLATLPMISICIIGICTRVGNTSVT